MTSRSAAAPVMVRILSDPKYLCVARSAAERFCTLAGLDAASSHAVGLALDEALANVIRHGYEGRCNQPIHIEFDRVEPGPEGPDPALRIRIRDYGCQVDASAINPRDLDELRPGGLGVHIMRSVMDEIRWRRRGLTGMELEMTKRIAPSAGSAGGCGQERS
ncbi:MAG: Serine-protein kinase RsbW [Phycisphaerae bacterium]|nr:Serine-protein kinase RsbW [Phycisphaerae bacterium]